MTVSNESIRDDYIGDNTTDTYDYSFQIFDDDHLLVVQTDDSGNETTLNIGLDYTVSGVGDAGGGSITLLAGNLATDYQLAIIANYPYTQDTDFRNQGSFLAQTHEDQFDRVVRQIQQLKEIVDRCIKFPVADNGNISALVNAVNRANNYLAFNNDGDVQVSTGTGADTGLRGDLASVLVTLGASLVGVHDASGNFTGDDVEYVLSELAPAAGFLAHENGTPDMNVVVDAGKLFYRGTLISQTSQTILLTAPSTNPKIDRIVIDKITGAVSVVAGTEAATPSAPAIPQDAYPICQVSLATSTTSIVDSMITDERTLYVFEEEPYERTSILIDDYAGNLNWESILGGSWAITGDGSGPILQISNSVTSETVDGTAFIEDYSQQLSFGADPSWDQERIIKFAVKHDHNAEGDIYIGTGNLDPGSLTDEHIAFRIDSDGNVYADYADGSANTSQLLTSFPDHVAGILEARFFPGDRIDFYVDGTLEHSASSDLPSGLFNAEKYLQIYTDKNVGSATMSFRLGRTVFQLRN